VVAGFLLSRFLKSSEPEETEYSYEEEESYGCGSEPYYSETTHHGTCFPRGSSWRAAFPISRAARAPNTRGALIEP